MIAADAEHRKQITKSSLRTWRQKKSFAQGAKRGQWGRVTTVAFSLRQ